MTAPIKERGTRRNGVRFGHKERLRYARPRRSRPRRTRARILISHPLEVSPLRRKEGKRRSLGGSSARQRGRGDRPATPSLAERRELVRQTVVHRVVRFRGQAEQVPRAPGILGIVLRRPDVMHRCCRDGLTVAHSFAAFVTVAAQNAAPKLSPSRRMITFPCHCRPPRRLRPFGSRAITSGQNKKTGTDKHSHTRVFIGSGLPDTGQRKYSR